MEKKSFNEQQENLVNSEIDYIKSILKEKGTIERDNLELFNINNSICP